MPKLVAPERKSPPPEAVRHNLRLTPARPTPTSFLKPNPLNAAIFREESDEYFRTLTADVKERGILVPLIAKSDGTLLAGHNRWKIAQELGLEYVPAQFVQENEQWSLDARQEEEFLIKDNLYRRHLTREEWIQTYRRLYPNFDEAVLNGSPGKRDGLTATKIAEDTGQNVDVVRKQLQSHKKFLNGKPSAERVSLSAKELRAAIERALAALQMKDVAQAREILEGALA